MANETYAKVTILGDSKSLVKAAKAGQKAMNQTQTAITKSAKLISRTLGTLGVALSFAALSATMDRATKAAIEDAKSQALLAKQMQNTVKATQLQTAAVEESISKMSIMAAVPDDEIRPAFATLLRSTKSVAKATKLTSLALDVAAGTGKDVGTVSKALSKAYGGNTQSLSKLGINVKKGGNWMKDLNRQFKGMADIAARQDPAKRLQVTFSELQEKLGQGMIPLLNKLADWFNANYDKIAKFFTDAWNSDVVKDVKNALKTLWEDYLVPFGKWVTSDETKKSFEKLWNAFKNLVGTLDDFAKTEFAKNLGLIANTVVVGTINAMADALNYLADAMDRLNGKKGFTDPLTGKSSTLKFNGLGWDIQPFVAPSSDVNTTGSGSGTAQITQNFYVQKMTGDEIIAQANKALRKSGKGRLVTG